MNTEEFRRRGKEMVDYICDYMDTISERRVTADVEPNYLRALLPEEAPERPESWDDIMADVESKIMPGITHWQHPQFHAYLTTRGDCYPSILADMLSDVIGCFSFSWASSPASTELETIVLDWLGKAINLPERFSSQSSGGGVIQSSASDCVLVCMLAARSQALCKLHQQDSSIPEAHHLPRLVAYTSREAHSCVQKAAKICLVQLRLLEPDSDSSLRGDTLSKAIEEDKAKGLVPFFVSAVLGSTASCSFDSLEELGPLAKQHDCWMHVDAAYAGCALICPEFQPLAKGMEYVDSINVNPYKWLLVSLDSSCMWVTDRTSLTRTFSVDLQPLYLQHRHEGQVFDYRNWGVPLSRRFRGLKLWFTLRSYGVCGLQANIRNHVRLAKRFENHLRGDARFEVCNNVQMGLVCFRLRGDGDQLTTDLLTSLNLSGKIHMVPGRVRGRYVIRLLVAAQRTTDSDIDYSWSLVSEYTTKLISTA